MKEYDAVQYDANDISKGYTQKEKHENYKITIIECLRVKESCMIYFLLCDCFSFLIIIFINKAIKQILIKSID